MIGHEYRAVSSGIFPAAPRTRVTISRYAAQGPAEDQIPAAQPPLPGEPPEPGGQGRGHHGPGDQSPALQAREPPGGIAQQRAGHRRGRWADAPTPRSPGGRCRPGPHTRRRRPPSRGRKAHHQRRRPPGQGHRQQARGQPGHPQAARGDHHQERQGHQGLGAAPKGRRRRPAARPPEQQRHHDQPADGDRGRGRPRPPGTAPPGRRRRQAPGRRPAAAGPATATGSARRNPTTGGR